MDETTKPNARVPSAPLDILELAAALLDYWFGPLTDASRLHHEDPDFVRCYRRWYSKDTAIDGEIRARFEAPLDHLTGTAERWMAATQAVRGDPRAALGLTLLVDQLPRNMFRDTARMYAYDDLALAHAYGQLEYGALHTLPLAERMFALVPLMHSENLTIQRIMEASFETLAADAAVRSPQNRAFFERALGFARRHRAVVERFGRFPHRNAILGRVDTESERVALANEDLGF